MRGWTAEHQVLSRWASGRNGDPRLEPCPPGRKQLSMRTTALHLRAPTRDDWIRTYE